MTVPDDLLPLATTQALLVLLPLALVLVSVVAKEIGTGVGETLEGGDDIGTLLQYRSLLLALVELLLLLLPFGIEKFDANVL